MLQGCYRCACCIEGCAGRGERLPRRPGISGVWVRVWKLEGKVYG